MIDTETKYGFNIPLDMLKGTVNRLTGQIWKLIPMLENDEDWKKQLDTVILEIAGLNEVFIECPQFLQILVKLESLKIPDIEFTLYRKTVFESISLLQEAIK